MPVSKTKISKDVVERNKILNQQYLKESRKFVSYKVSFGETWLQHCLYSFKICMSRRYFDP